MMIEEIPIKSCHGCSKATESSEWIDSIPNKNKAFGKIAERMKVFKCSACGHEMYSVIVKEFIL